MGGQRNKLLQIFISSSLHMDQETIIQKTAEFVKESFKDAEGSHDRWHTYRVWKNAIHIGEQEHVDLFVVQLAALLHDIGDRKYNVEGE